MTTETDERTATSQQDHAEEEAAFAASFEGKDLPAATKPQASAEPKEGATQAAAATEQAEGEASRAVDPKASAGDPAQATAATTTTPAKEAAPTPAPSPQASEVAELKAELRRVHGRFGALHDELKQLKATKEAEGKPAAATPLELAGMREQYPELADILTADLGKALAGLAGKANDPKEVETLVMQRVQEGVAQEAARLREAAVSDAHPNWQADLFKTETDPATGKAVKKPSAEYLAWKTSIGEDEARAFEDSDNPYRVIRGLNAFYEWKNKAAKAEEAKQQRLKAAVQPQGVPRATPSTLSDDEAMRKGFEEGFNS